MEDKILVYQEFEPDTLIRLRHTNNSWKTPEQHTEKADEIAKALAEDKTLIRLTRNPIFNTNSPKLYSLDTELCKYSQHKATINEPDINYRANPIYVSALLTTVDGYLTFLKMSPRNNWGAGDLNIAATPLEENDILGTGSSLEKGLLRILNSEIGINQGRDVNKMSPEMLFALEGDSTQKVGSFLYRTNSNMSKEEIENRFKELGKDKGKYSELSFIKDSEQEVKDALNNNNISFRPMVRGLLNHLYR